MCAREGSGSLTPTTRIRDRGFLLKNRSPGVAQVERNRKWGRETGVMGNRLQNQESAHERGSSATEMVECHDGSPRRETEEVSEKTSADHYKTRIWGFCLLTNTASTNT